MHYLVLFFQILGAFSAAIISLTLLVLFADWALNRIVRTLRVYKLFVEFMWAKYNYKIELSHDEISYLRQLYDDQDSATVEYRTIALKKGVTDHIDDVADSLYREYINTKMHLHDKLEEHAASLITSLEMCEKLGFVRKHIDPRPECIKCGRRWVPNEGVDATVSQCGECQC
jgi:hypothetical protein